MDISTVAQAEVDGSGSVSPFDRLPPEMLQHILLYVVGKVGINRRRKDLAAARLVCTSWNQCVVKILKSLPLHINLNELIQLSSNKDPCTSFTTTSMGRSSHEKHFILNVTESDTRLRGKRLERLQTLKEKIYPITTIKLLKPGSVRVESFWNLLHLASNTLKEVNLHLVLEPPPRADQAEVHLNNDPSQFPQLTTIKCYMDFEQLTDNEINTVLNTLIQLLHQTPNLKSFKLRDEIPHRWTHEKETKKLQILNMISSTTLNSNLEEFELTIYGETIFTALLDMTFNQLKKLQISLNMSSNYIHRIEFGSFLHQNCPRLTNLYIHLSNDNDIFHPPRQFNNIQFNHFQTLPKLTQLGLSCLSRHAFTKNFEPWLQFMTTKLASLQTITTDLRTILEFWTPPGNLERILPYTSVTTMILKVGQMDGLFMVTRRTRFRNLLRVWLPNLQHLVIDSSYEIFTKNDWKSGHASQAMDNFWRFDGVRKLEFRKSSRDWLGELLKCNPSTLDMRETLQHLRLHYSAKLKVQAQDDEVEDDDGNDVDVQNLDILQQDQNPQAFLNSICTSFPNITLIQIDEEILNFDGTFKTEEILLAIRSVRDNNPGVVFELQ